MFGQLGNLHDEYLVNKSTSNQGADVIIVHHLGQLSQDSENLSKGQTARGKSPSGSLGALDMNSSNESCMIRHLLVVWQRNTTDSDYSLYPESTDIVEKYYA